MPQPPALLPSPYGRPIPACYLRDVRDVFVVLTAWHKGQLPECTRRLKDSEKHAYITSGWCVIFPPDICGVSRWTDQLKWSPSRVQGPFFVYRQLDASCSRSQRKGRSSPYHNAAASRPRANSAPRQTLRSPSTSDDDEWSNIEFERWLVSSWTNNGTFTKNGLCRKTIAVELYGREYRIISYYNPLDVRNGNLVRASDHPAYAGLELDPVILREAKYKTREKNEVRIHLLADLLNGGRPRAAVETIIRDSDSAFGGASTSGSSDSSIYSPVLSTQGTFTPSTSGLPVHVSRHGHGHGLSQPDIHWVPIEPAQAPQVPLALAQQGYMKVEADVDDGIALRSISRMQSFAPPAGPPPTMQYTPSGLPTPLQSPTTQPAVQEEHPYVYELSHALHPITSQSNRRPTPRIRTAPSPASDSTVYSPPVSVTMTSIHSYPPLSTAAATMPPPLYFPPTPPLSGEEQPPALAVAYYPMPDDFMPLSIEPLDLTLPNTLFNFNSTPVSEAHEQNARATHGHTRF